MCAPVCGEGCAADILSHQREQGDGAKDQQRLAAAQQRTEFRRKADGREEDQQQCVAWHGLEKRCASIRTLDGSFRAISEVQEEKADLLVKLACRAIEEDQADVILLAGVPLAGLGPKVAERIPVPVVDCVGAAVKQAEALVTLSPKRRALAPSEDLTPSLLSAWRLPWLIGSPTRKKYVAVSGRFICLA